MSKSRTRIMVALLALVFSLVSTGIVTEARDGVNPVRRKARRHHRVVKKTVPPNGGTPGGSAGQGGTSQSGAGNQPPGGGSSGNPGGGGGGGNVITRLPKKIWKIVKKPFTKSGGKDTAKLNRYQGEDYGGNY